MNIANIHVFKSKDSMINVGQWLDYLTSRRKVRRSILASSYAVTFMFDVLLI